MKLYILNDDVNSFNDVTSVIQQYLNYPYMQSVSIAHIIHDVGRCLVKESDDSVELEELRKNLIKSGLTVKLEKQHE